MTEILENIFAAEVPIGAKQLHIDWNLKETNQYIAYKFKDDELANEYEIKTLPPGPYEILFTTKDCTEEQVMGLVAVKEANGYPIGFKDYGSDDNSISFREAKDSLQSLLRSHGLSTDKNYLLVRKTS